MIFIPAGKDTCPTGNLNVVIFIPAGKDTCPTSNLNVVIFIPAGKDTCPTGNLNVGRVSYPPAFLEVKSFR